MDAFYDDVHETNTTLNRARKALANEVLYDETKALWQKALEFADVRRLQWAEKGIGTKDHPCQHPISIDEFLDFCQLKVLTTKYFKA